MIKTRIVYSHIYKQIHLIDLDCNVSVVENLSTANDFILHSGEQK